MKEAAKVSPCVGCSRVKDPQMCENKNCSTWRRWFLDRWELIHNFPLRIGEKEKGGHL